VGRAFTKSPARRAQEHHLKAAAAQRMFTFDDNYRARRGDPAPSEMATRAMAATKRFAADELEQRHAALRKERLEVYMQVTLPLSTRLLLGVVVWGSPVGFYSFPLIAGAWPTTSSRTCRRGTSACCIGSGVSRSRRRAACRTL
jgi:hypothetical protein